MLDNGCATEGCNLTPLQKAIDAQKLKKHEAEAARRKCAKGNKNYCSAVDRIVNSVKNDVDPNSVYGQALEGDSSALVDFLLPTEIGWRMQLEVCIKVPIPIGPCGSGGVNFVYNRSSDQLISFLDWSGAGGPGTGGGASLTTGPLVGWFAEDTKHLASGTSAIVGGTLAYEGAISVSASSPLTVDKKYGTLPVLYYGGVGVGYAYAGGGVGASYTSISADATSLLPWHWNR
jgi:hypothetical protein